MSIQSFIDFEPMIDRKKLIYRFTANGQPMTELRLVAFNQKLDTIIKTLYDDKIKKVYFVFNIEKLLIPSNFTLLADFATVFRGHHHVLKEKLMFTIVQNSTNVFLLFFRVFKQYYNPVKSLYLCLNDDQVFTCLHDEESRHSFPNILSLIEQEKEDSTHESMPDT